MKITGSTLVFPSSPQPEQVDGNKVVLPPPVDLEEFFSIRPPYKSTPVTIARHSSQGDSKYPNNIVDIVKDNPDKKFIFMPAPTFMPDLPNVVKCEKMPVKEFLSKASCFLYTLPENYTDQGPRVVMEAMAAGLPVITEKRCGMKDSVTDKEGWFDVGIIKNLTPQMLAQKGAAARERARTFKKEDWIKEITCCT